MAEEETKTDDSFDDAFAKFLQPDPAPTPTAEAEEQPVTEETTEETTEGDDDTTAAQPEESEETEEAEEAEETPEAAEAEGGEEAAEPEPKPAEKDVSDEDLLSKFADMVKNAAPKDDAQPEPEQARPEQQELPEIYTDEEKEVLAAYEKDWPDVRRAEALQRRAEYRDLVTYMFDQMRAAFDPIAEQVATLADTQQLTELRTRVEDYDDVRDDVVAWVDDQPAYLQDAYKRVISEGTADEVADLISRFKRDTGATPAPAAPKKEKAELPPTAKKAAASLAPVSTKRTAPPKKDDPTDFESAFERFAANS